MSRYVWPAASIAQLWHYADSWALLNCPDFKRQSLRCKTMALINQDRIFDNSQE